MNLTAPGSYRGHTPRTMEKEDRDDLLEALAEFVKQYDVIDGHMVASDYCVYYTPMTGWTADLAECTPVLPFITAENCGINSREDAERALADPALWASNFLLTRVLRADVYQSKIEKREFLLTQEQMKEILMNGVNVYLLDMSGDNTPYWREATLAYLFCHRKAELQARRAMLAAGIRPEQIPTPEYNPEDDTLCYYFNLQR